MRANVRAFCAISVSSVPRMSSALLGLTSRTSPDSDIRLRLLRSRWRVVDERFAA